MANYLGNWPSLTSRQAVYGRKMTQLLMLATSNLREHNLLENTPASFASP